MEKTELQYIENNDSSSLQRFAKKHNISFKYTDKKLLLIIVGLVLFGFIMVFSAESYTVVVNGKRTIGSFLKEQFFVVLLGFLLMTVTSLIDYHKYNKIFLIILGVLVLVINILPIRTSGIAGARRWIFIGGLSFQPSEIAKYYLVVLISYIITDKKEKMTDKKKFVISSLVLGIFAVIILAIQRNLSTTGIVFMIFLTLFFISDLSRIYYKLIGVAGMILAFLASFFITFRKNRVDSYFDPFKDPTGEGHQIVQSFFAIASGGFFGRGLGNSRLKAFWLPVVESDFIFALVCEETGILGAMVLLFAFWMLIHRGMFIARSAKDDFGKYIAAGISTVIAAQVFINVAVVTKVIPVTGVTLPFISSGGTSLVVNLTAMGILLNVAKQAKAEEVKNRIKEAENMDL